MKSFRYPLGKLAKRRLHKSEQGSHAARNRLHNEGYGTLEVVFLPEGLAHVRLDRTVPIKHLSGVLNDLYSPGIIIVTNGATSCQDKTTTTENQSPTSTQPTSLTCSAPPTGAMSKRRRQD